MSDLGRNNLNVPETAVETPDHDLCLTEDHAYKMPRMSATSCSTFKACKRLWWFGKVAKVTEVVKGRALYVGIEVHDLLEEYLKNGTRPDPHAGSGQAIAYAGIHLIPDPGTCGVEDWISGVKCGPLAFAGKVDMYDMTGSDTPRAGWDGMLWIGDHKTSSDPAKWGKTPEELARNPQLLAYAYGLIKSQGIPEPAPTDRIGVSHVYYKSRGAPLGLRVDATTTWDKVLDNWRSFEKTAGEMFSLAKVDRSDSVPPNRASCGRYGGCPMSSICSASPANRKAANAARLVQPAQTIPGRESSMATQSPEDVRAALFGNAAPAAATPPPDTGINPPDAAPEENPTDAMISEAATFVKNMLDMLPSLPASGFDKILTRVGLDKDQAAYVLDKAGAGFTEDGAHIKTGLSTDFIPDSYCVALPPEPAPLPVIETTEAAPAPTTSAVAATEAVSGNNGDIINAVYAKLQESGGSLKMKDVGKVAKFVLGWSRIGAKRLKAVCLDGELAGLFRASDDLKTVSLIGAEAPAETPAPVVVEPDPEPAAEEPDPVVASTEIVDEFEELAKIRAAAAAIDALPDAEATVTEAPAVTPAPVEPDPEPAGNVVYVDCRPDNGATDFAAWIAPCEDAVQKSAGKWPYSMPYNDGQKAVASRLLVALRDGALSLPPHLFIRTDHPASAVCLAILARCGVAFVRGVR